MYMKLKYIFIIFILFLSNFSFAKKNVKPQMKNIVFFNYITFQIPSDQIYTFQILKNLETLQIYNKAKSPQLVIAEDFRPQSIESIKKRAVEVGLSVDKIKVFKKRNYTIFTFEKDDFVNIFSTRGGRLLVHKQLFKPSQIDILTKKQRKIAKL